MKGKAEDYGYHESQGECKAFKGMQLRMRGQ